MATLTQVQLFQAPRRLQVRLRFGLPLKVHQVDPIRSEAWFTPHAILALSHWEANDYGTTQWWFAVLRTVNPGERAETVEHVTPGAEVLLQVRGADRVRTVFALIAHIEALQLLPRGVSPSYWRTVHNRLAARREPPVYRLSQHAAYCRQRAVLR